MQPDPSAAPPRPAGELRYGFALGGLLLVPAAGVLTELVDHAQVHPIPRSAAALAGVLNLHGTIVPLFDLAALGRARTDIRPLPRRALVFDREERRAGLLVESLPELVTLVPPELPAAAPAGPLAPFLVRAWAQADRPQRRWWEIDHRAAFEFLARGGDSSSTQAAAALAGDHVTEVL